MVRYRIPPKVRFYDKIIDGQNGCRLWAACKSKAGYGNFRLDGENRLSHRLVWEWERGPIPPGMHICHSCDTPACVNPDHLFLGTPADNMADKIAKGRQSYGLDITRNRKCKLAASDVLAIRNAVGVPHRKLAKLYGVTHAYIGKIIRGDRWKGELDERAGA